MTPIDAVASRPVSQTRRSMLSIFVRRRVKSTFWITAAAGLRCKREFHHKISPGDRRALIASFHPRSARNELAATSRGGNCSPLCSFEGNLALSSYHYYYTRLCTVTTMEPDTDRTLSLRDFQKHFMNHGYISMDLYGIL